MSREAVLRSLEPLFEQAAKEKKWFLSTYQAIEFSPNELRKAHAEGRFVWGAVNWQLIEPPKPYDIAFETERMLAHNDALKMRIDAGWELSRTRDGGMG